MTYALDTSILIFMLNKDNKVAENRDRIVLAGDRFVIPPIVDYEIQRGLLYKPSPNKEKIYFALRKHYGVGMIEPDIWVRAAHIYVELRKKGFTVGDDDIFIAAFCLYYGYTLVTRNTKDFENIAGMKHENWIDGNESV